jgi:hypothetical protein
VDEALKKLKKETAKIDNLLERGAREEVDVQELNREIRQAAEVSRQVDEDQGVENKGVNTGGDKRGEQQEVADQNGNTNQQMGNTNQQMGNQHEGNQQLGNTNQEGGNQPRNQQNVHQHGIQQEMRGENVHQEMRGEMTGERREGGEGEGRENQEKNHGEDRGDRGGNQGGNQRETKEQVNTNQEGVTVVVQDGDEENLRDLVKDMDRHGKK